MRCMPQVGAASHHYAELAGRSETNAVDVVRAAEAGLDGLRWGCLTACLPVLKRVHRLVLVKHELTLPAAMCRRWH